MAGDGVFLSSDQSMIEEVGERIPFLSPPFFFPLASSPLLSPRFALPSPLEVGHRSYGIWGSAVSSPQRGLQGAESQSKSNLVHFSLKI